MTMGSRLGEIMRGHYWLLVLATCLIVVFGQGTYGKMAMATVTPQSLVSSVSVPDNAHLRTRVAQTATVDDYLDSGQVFYDAGQLNAAISDWQQALALAPNSPYQQAIAHNYLAIGYQGLGDWSQADAHIQQGLARLAAVENSAFLTAQLLNTLGSLQLQTGHADQALETWQNAIALYQSVTSGGTTLAIARTRINEALALRVLGFYRRAKIILDEVQLPRSAPTELQLSVLQSLGDTLLRIGDPAQAKAVFSEALTLAQNPEQQAVVQLSLGQTLAALGERQTALELYQQAREQGTSTTQMEAFLNQLALKIEAAADPVVAVSDIGQELDLFISQLSALPPSRWGINSQVYLANLLMDTSEIQQGTWGISPQAIGQQLAHALAQSRSLQDHQAEASVLVQLGHLYEQTQQWDSALDLTQQALALMSSSPASYANAQGQWQLARILKAQDSPAQALVAYSSAVNQLEALQYDVVALNPNAKFSFRDRIEPVYRGYVELLLTDIQQQPDASRQQQLQKAQDTMEALQLAELQNYFREACLTYQTRKIEEIDPHAAIVYPILLNNRIEVIVSMPHQALTHYSTELPFLDQEQWLRDILSSLHPASSANAVVPFGQQLYNWLLAPIASQLEQQAIETIVFVPDGFLRNIPMSILHDGNSYLLDHYNLALTPSMQLLNSRPLASGPLKVLTAGLTRARQGFGSLPAVNQEINQIEQLVSANVLLNDQFTRDNIFEQSSQNEFSIVHLATHGQFSASADDTFLLTWNDRINVKDLGDLFQASQRRDAPIELLVLSACQTALGDRRAALGMAGVAIESGARSTVATLWSIQDESTSAVMGEFYRQLIDKQQPRAQALRNAQLMLMQDPIYQHPYYWAPFVLIGNWQ